MRKKNIKREKNDIRILTLDDDSIMTLTLQSYFEASGYDVDTENDPYKAIERIRDGSYDILLLDFLMSPICGDAVVASIREFNKDLFIILLTGHKSMAPPVKTIRELDIQGYYEKCERFDQLELLVESCVKSIHQMRTIREYRDSLKKANEELHLAYERLTANYGEMVTAVRAMVDARDIYTRGHSDRVAILAVHIARELGWSAEECDRLRVIGMFHDIGKIRIPDSILLKDGRLTDAEYDEIRRHPLYAEEILKNSSMFMDIVPGVAAHHERYDGGGYPRGIKGRDIPMEARILSVCDAFDAMTSYRRYRENMTLGGALKELENGSGTQFDPEIVKIALRLFNNMDDIKKDELWDEPVRHTDGGEEE